LLGKELTRAAAEEQHSCCLLKTTTLTTLHELAGLSHLITPTNQIPLKSQSPVETTSQLPLEHQYQDWTPKE
jgi:hypothetical protein